MTGPVRALAMLLAAASWLASGAALAHPILDDARSAYESAAFERAATLLDEAERRDDLTRDDLIVLYDLRSLVSFALGDQASMDRALAALATLAPGFDVPSAYPPAWRTAFERARADAAAAPRLDLDGHDAGDHLEVRLRAHDGAGLGREIALSYRRDRGAYVRVLGETLRIPWERAAAIDAFGELVGAGGAVLARAGSAGEPLRFAREGTEAEAASSPWPLILAGVGAVVVAATIAILLSTRPDPNTVLSGARVVPPME